MNKILGMLLAIAIVGFVVAFCAMVFFGPAAFVGTFIATVIIVTVVYIFGYVAKKIDEEKEEKELAEHGLEKIRVTRRIEHSYDGLFPFDSEEERVEEIIVRKKKE